MAEKSKCLFQSKSNRQAKLNTNGTSVLFTGSPFRHFFHYPHGLLFQSAAFLFTNCFYIHDRSICIDYKLYDNCSLDVIFSRNRRIVDMFAEIFHQFFLAARERRHLFYELKYLVFLFLGNSSGNTTTGFLYQPGIDTIGVTFYISSTNSYIIFNFTQIRGALLGGYVLIFYHFGRGIFHRCFQFWWFRCRRWRWRWRKIGFVKIYLFQDNVFLNRFILFGGMLCHVPGQCHAADEYQQQKRRYDKGFCCPSAVLASHHVGSILFISPLEEDI